MANFSTKGVVTLNKRPTKDGGQSLYLDYYVNGKRCREFLKMYLVPEKTRLDKVLNQETLKNAAIIQARRNLEIQEGIAKIKRRKSKKTLLQYIDAVRNRYTERGQTQCACTQHKLYNWVKRYKGDIPLAAVDKDYCAGFAAFLNRSHLEVSSAHTYFAALGNVFNRAVKSGDMEYNPITRMEKEDKPPKGESKREYLTLAEVKRLAATPCREPEVAKAFLFSVFSGLRISDIRALRWENICETNIGYQVEKMQRKTGRFAYIPLSENALAQLPPRKKTGLVFTIPSSSHLSIVLRQWAQSANIRKNVTFHTARHTCATLLLTYGADLYTVSSILGHTNITTTQIYAKVVDANKRKAVDLIPSL